MRVRAWAAVAALASLLVAALPPGASRAADVSAPAATDSSAVPPVVVVLDLSGSMNDDDGTGLIKLTGAKKAVDQVVRGMPASQPFGLWAYPGGQDSCGSGSFAITPAPITDLNGTIAKVDALTADGGTPTGPALQGAADTLTSQGTRTASLVLVSDGESNCGDNPCQVAEDLHGKGFDVTIHAVGFRVSEPGRAELNCVAAATGGTYVDVDNSAELNRTLLDLTRAKLRVQLPAAATQSDIAQGRVSVTVSNTSVVTASDVQLLLTVAGGVPANLNASVRVGNLPPGTSSTRVWVLGARFDPTASTPEWASSGSAAREVTIDAWARNADRVSVSSTLGPGADSGATSKSDLGDVLRGPLDAGHPIVILGDSYSAGEGTFDYLTPPDDVSPGCHRSEKTYLVPALDPGDVENLACSGAVSWDFYYKGKDRTPPQLTQLADLEQAPGAVVMTLGGNDIGFASIVEQCVVHSCDSSPAQVAAWKSAADSLRTWLAPVYEDVWKTANLPSRVDQRNGAYAPVVVLAYPQVTHATKYGACGDVSGVKDALGAGEVRVANELLAHLNAALRAAVADARDAGHEIYVVSDTADVMLPFHTLCDGADAYVNGILLEPTSAWPPIKAKQESVHPNVSGYSAETAAIVGWSATVTTRGPDTGPDGPVAAEVTGIPWSLIPIGMPTVDTSAQGTIDGTLLQGGPVKVQGGGYQPGTPVIVEIHSTPAVLGTLVADEDGYIHGELHLPPSLELGRHEIVALGTAADGGFREDHVAVSVLARPPLWTQLALLGAGLLLVTSVTLAVRWRRRPVS